MQTITAEQYFRSDNMIYKYDENEDGLLPNYMTIANTPLELIQIEDLVELFNFATKKRFKVEITGFRTHHISTHHLEYDLHMFTITKIYTPNKDKSQYTLQYSKEAK